MKRLYGITSEQYDALSQEQGGKCAICKKLPEGTGKHSRLHVDHDHITKKIRGLLCVACNTTLGNMEDDSSRLRAAADYVDQGGVTHIEVRLVS